jgi:predicted nucleic acid-binding protein
LWDSRLGCISIQVLQELYVSLTRKIPNPLTFDQAGRIVSDFRQWRHHVPTSESILDAVDIQHRCIFLGCHDVCSALKLKCTALWTEDLNHGQDYDGVRALNPFFPEGL